MPRRVVLVDLYWTRDQDPRVPLGHASLLAALHASGAVDVRSVVAPVNAGTLNPNAILETILGHATGLPAEDVDVALGAYVWAEDLIQVVLHGLRAHGFAGRIILGGPQISYAGPGVDALYPKADAFVRGYGELAICALARTPGRPEIAGVHYAGSADRCEQARVDLAALPSPWLSGAIPLSGQRFVRWETQRGCPFRCSFCQHREPGARLLRRELAANRVIDEIDLFCAAGVEDIAVLDPIFNIGPLASRVLERFVMRRFAGRLSLQCRAECADSAFLELAARLDTRLEFGLQTIHAREGDAILRRNDMGKVEAALGGARRLGLAHEVSLIFGLPEQTVTSFRESVQWCLDQRVPVIKAFPLMLLRGTELDRERGRWDLVESEGPMATVIASRTFGPEDWHEMARLSEALRLTEGCHPEHVEDLLRIAHVTEPALTRWRPVSSRQHGAVERR